MARLNEPAAESIESLKRRFVRQNRDLARTNSNQSVKIRNLENEISRLLAENCELREHIIQLNGQLQEYDGAQKRMASVAMVKERLDAKMQEFTEILAELDGARQTTRRRKSQVSSPKKSPIAKNRRPHLPNSDSVIEEEGKLPTIVEDKHFPRKTLEPVELRSVLSQDANDSPDIGPPPKLFFDRQAENWTASSSSARQDHLADTASDAFPGLLSANFETRRRRRESQIRPAIDSTSSEPASSPAKNNISTKQYDTLSSKPLRAGMKRKIDGEETKNQSSAETKDSVNRGLAGTQSSVSAPVARKVLGPKPVNTDPVVSPRKPRASESGKADPPSKSEPKKYDDVSSKEQQKEREIHIPVEENEVIQSAEIPVEPIKLEPKTPGLHDIFSPGSSHPSDVKPEGRGDTPPPAELLSRTGLGEDPGASGRGSRRARPQVSYVEPSLNSKMRRPTKDLVDAVATSNGKSSAKPSEHSERTSQTNPTPASEKQGIRTVVIKKEDPNARDWKPSSRVTSQELHRADPQSPLQEKEKEDQDAHVEVIRRVKSNAERRRSDLHVSASLNSGENRSDAAATSAESIGADKLERALSSLNIFDVGDTPPDDSKRCAKPALGEHFRSASSLSSRTSSMTSSKASGSGPSSTLSRPGNRRQTLGGVESAKAGGVDRGSTAEKRDTKLSRSDVAVNAAADSGAGSHGGAIGRHARGERAAARRRSMML